MLSDIGRYWRFLLPIVLLLLLLGCSRVQFAYRQLDWLIPYYVDDYIRLSDTQDTYLETEVDSLLRWHCANHLKDYAELLREANRDFQQGSMDIARLRVIVGKIERYWKAIKHRASPAIANLFLTSSQTQLDKFLDGLDERNRDWLKAFESQTPEALSGDYRDRMTDELERWFGPLTSVQQAEVSAWSRRFNPLGLLGLEARRRWQASLSSLLERRADEAAFYAGIENLFVNPEIDRSAEYLSRIAENQEATLTMLAIVAGQLNTKQRRHLDAMVNSISTDFDQLSCIAEVPNAPPVRTGHPIEDWL